MPTPITVSASLIDLTGNAISGYIKAAIVSPTGIYDLYVSGTGIIVPKISTSSVSANPSVQIWGTDVVVDLADNTSDTYYDVSIYDATNNLVFRASYYFTGAGPINLVGFAPIAFLPPPPTFSAPPIAQLPGGSNGSVQFNNAGVFGGDSTFFFTSATKVVTGSIFNGSTGFQYNGTAPTGQVLVGNGTNFIAGLVPWSSLTNPTANLTLANGAFTTTFNHSSNAAWTWANTTASTSGSQSNAPPTLSLTGTFWDTVASASQTGTWTLSGTFTPASQTSAALNVGFSGTGGHVVGTVLFSTNVQANANLQANTLTSQFATGAASAVYNLTAAGNASAGLTTYSATIPGGGQWVLGQNVTIAGFTNAGNNGTFVVHDSTITTLTVFNGGGVAESHAATATAQGTYFGDSGFDFTVFIGNSYGILGNTYLPSASLSAVPYVPYLVMGPKGDSKDSAYFRTVNDGSTGNHYFEVGSIIDGSGAAPVLFQLGHLSSASLAVLNVPLVASNLIVNTATPTGSSGQLSLGTTTGFGNGSSGTAVTTTLKSTGTGPTTPQTVVNYLEIDLAGTKFWMPLVQ